jgi:hypothetical protein
MDTSNDATTLAGSNIIHDFKVVSLWISTVMIALAAE